MNITSPISLLAFAFSLTACMDSASQIEQTQVTEAQPGSTKAISVNTLGANNSAVQDAVVTKQQDTPDQPAQTGDPVKEPVVAVAVVPELPQGRLTGIVSAGEQSQVIIEHAEKKFYLRKDGQWDGWTITSINPRDITISMGDEEHKLALHSSFHAPTLSAAESSRRAQALRGETQQPIPSIPPLVLTEQELEEVSSRLLMD